MNATPLLARRQRRAHHHHHPVGGAGIFFDSFCTVPTDSFAQVTASSAFDPDSTPNNYVNGYARPAVEDDVTWVHQDAFCGTYGPPLDG